MPVLKLSDVSLSIEEHMASLERSGERAIATVTDGSIRLDLVHVQVSSSARTWPADL
jgi:hypothetical protein